DADLLAEHRRVELAVRDVEHDALAEADGIQVASVVPKRQLGERSGLHIIHERLRHASVGALPQILDACDPVGDPGHSSPRAAISVMRSPILSALAWIVSDGLTPPLV